MLPVTITPVLAKVALLGARAMSKAASSAAPLACIAIGPVV